MTDKNKNEAKINKLMTVEEKFNAYPPNKFEWDGNNVVLDDNGVPKKKPGKPVGQKQRHYRLGGKFSAAKQRDFLEALAKYGTISSACASVGISRRCIYNHKQKSEGFAEKMDNAVLEYRASLENEVDDRIKKGNVKSKYDGDGNLIEKVITQDNSLLLRALERHDPSWGKRQQNETNVNVNHNAGDAVNKLAEALGVRLPDKSSDDIIDITDYEEE